MKSNTPTICLPTGRNKICVSRNEGPFDQRSRIRRPRCAPRRGAMLVLILVMLVGFLATVVFSVDIAQMHLARTELRTATDAASQAASQELARTLNKDLAIEKGQEIARLNFVSGQPLELAVTDFDFGRSDPQPDGAFAFSSGDSPINSVRVTGRRTADSPSGAIPLMMGNVMGLKTFEPQITAAATYVERDVILVVDRSGSMRGDKWSDLKEAIDVFTETLSKTPVEEHVGLASYSKYASQDISMTTNLSTINSGLSDLSTGGRTSISRGMKAGSTILAAGRSRDFVQRTMIVMTDGKHNEGPEPRTIASSLAADGVQIHTITFGSGADESRMREVAAIGSGRHLHALSADELVAAYREIALTLGTMMTE